MAFGDPPKGDCSGFGGVGFGGVVYSGHTSGVNISTTSGPLNAGGFVASSDTKYVLDVSSAWQTPCVLHTLGCAELDEDGAINGSCVECGARIVVDRVPGGMPVLRLEKVLVSADDPDIDPDELLQEYLDVAEDLALERRKLEDAEAILRQAQAAIAERLGL